MNNTLILVLIIVFVVMIVIVTVILFLSIRAKSKGKSEIHFLDGADMKSGRLSVDNNFFKGFSGTLEDTVVVNENSLRDSGIVVSLRDLSNGSLQKVLVTGEMTMGREADFVVHDKSASRMHCKIIASGGKLYLMDLESSNHTFLNEKRIYDKEELSNRDIIRIGKTKLEITF